ncbi:SAM-dependent methyltransferase [Actinomadura craniellae]|uniref:SAM-dependent methyltransferase n=1 Tax=Actinomadura craniellae TaxID=2231787 RepID=A0A365H315_9ACTN|nr:SAM-dependent methyltransferase [Actinomadura craniellae]RAY12613.1 SAM-dependent methyltransferase [Actinomadura craniellae]
MDGEQAPPGVDVATPNTARIYDYYLGGKDNYRADRQAAEQVLSVAPETPRLAWENRAFLGRAVRYLVGAGIRQFIDVGSGLPTRENVHETAQRAAPDARVAYVDRDPVVLIHSRALLATDAQTAVVEADMRRPDDILDDPELRRLIDLDRPVAVLFVAALHCLTDDDKPAGVVARFQERMAPGSHLVISHITAQEDAETAQRGAEVYRRVGATTQMTLRDRAQLMNLFDGFELVEPGLVPLPDWRPETPFGATVAPPPKPRRGPLPIWFLCGVGRLP